MTEKNIQMQKKNADGSFDIYYPKTKAANVIAADGSTLESHLAEKAKYQTSSGSNAITINTGGNFEYSQGNWVKWIQALNNTGSVTINVDGKGAKALRNFNGTAMASGDLEAGSPYEAFYSAGSDFFVLRPRGAKLDTIIAAIVSKGGTVATPQKVAEIVAAINNISNWSNTGLKRWATGNTPASSATRDGTLTVSGLNFQPSYVFMRYTDYATSTEYFVAHITRFPEYRAGDNLPHWGAYASTNANNSGSRRGTEASFTSNGFSCLLFRSASMTVTWVAYE